MAKFELERDAAAIAGAKATLEQEAAAIVKVKGDTQKLLKLKKQPK